MRKIITTALSCTGLPRPPFGRPRNDVSAQPSLRAKRGNPETEKKTGFTLIELLVSLIIISIITAAFVPMLSKKLKHREIVLAAKSTSIDCVPEFGEHCLACNKNNCTICSTSFSVADGMFVDPELDCDPKECSIRFGETCSRCNKTHCTGCIEGYGYDSSSHACKQCMAPDYSYGGTNSCKRCDSGYQYQNADGASSCKTCDTANGWFPNADRKGCTQTKCVKGHYRSGSNCPECSDGTYQANDNFTGTSCNSCNIIHPNCTQCSKIGCCSACSGEYKISGCSCVLNTCTPSATQYQKTATQCPECSSVLSHCIKCTSGTNCTECEDGWHSEGGVCVVNVHDLLPSKENCAKINAIYIAGTYNGGTAICVSKRNAGDSGGPSIPSTVTIRSVATSGYSASTTSPYCYRGGRTAATTCSTAPTTTSPAYDYEACNRTVCNWPAAKAICDSYIYTSGDIVADDWRLPKKAEVDVWKSYSTTITTSIGTNGLQLCDQNSSAKAYRCNCGTSQCKGAGSGDSAGNCHAHAFWLLEENGDKANYGDYESGSIKSPGLANKKDASSTRCVIEKFRG